ncbi:unnamed protein product [Cuscuta epithymum]|uniref:Uncharacterized protein n=1 Tax=Cuscuta epithymum TaxID=186058 RepID=A0AAV0D5P6_9ASTE|nr:unnamed protein product [Cuscuta epithymum]
MHESKEKYWDASSHRECPKRRNEGTRPCFYIYHSIILSSLHQIKNTEMEEKEANMQFGNYSKQIYASIYHLSCVCINFRLLTKCGNNKSICACNNRDDTKDQTEELEVC